MGLDFNSLARSGLLVLGNSYPGFAMSALAYASFAMMQHPGLNSPTPSVFKKNTIYPIHICACIYKFCDAAASWPLNSRTSSMFKKKNLYGSACLRLHINAPSDLQIVTPILSNILGLQGALLDTFYCIPKRASSKRVQSEHFCCC